MQLTARWGRSRSRRSPAQPRGHDRAPPRRWSGPAARASAGRPGSRSPWAPEYREGTSRAIVRNRCPAARRRSGASPRPARPPAAAHRARPPARSGGAADGHHGRLRRAWPACCSSASWASTPRTPTDCRRSRSWRASPLDEGSRVVSADGVELATFASERRDVVPYDEIPQLLIDAQVSAEDRTFWKNPCIDFRGIVRAALQNLTAGEQVSGASTICQQLVRIRLFDADLMADPDRLYERKIKEWILALRVGERYAGTGGQGADPRDVHEPGLLREPGLRHQGRGAGLLRQGHHLRRP